MKQIAKVLVGSRLHGLHTDTSDYDKEVYTDIEEEEKENIKDQLYAIYKGDIMKYATFGLAQWYKEKLVKGEEDV